MKPITREWLTFAQKDLANCERILEDEFLTNIVAFHAQQAVEKSFKAVIEEYALKFIKTHDVIRLAEVVRPHLPFELDDELLASVNEVYIDSRYPGEFGLLPFGDPTLADAKLFYQFAKDLFTQIHEFLS